MERRERVQGLRGQEGPQTLSLVKDKSYHGDPRAAKGSRGKPGDCGIHRPTVSEAAERSR